MMCFDSLKATDACGSIILCLDRALEAIVVKNPVDYSAARACLLIYAVLNNIFV